MTMAGSFLGGAKNRLLPLSVPFRFFLTAAAFHVLAWLILLIGAEDLAAYSGGLGTVLASVHLLTLGVLAMTAIGASYQLLPVVTRQPLVHTWPASLSYWLFTSGILILTYGMVAFEQNALVIGGFLAAAGLAIFTLLTADNLRRAGSIAVVAAHGWVALAALIAAVILALVLIFDFSSGFLSRHMDVAVLHMVLASFGFMGLLVLGFSQILVPMFLLSRNFPTSLGWMQLAVGICALANAAIGILLDVYVLLVLAAMLGLVSTGLYLWLIRSAFRSAMRKRQGLSFILIKSSWVMMALGLILGCLLLSNISVPNSEVLFGFVVLAGWLLTFVMGILQRIMPFLASMHASSIVGKPPMLSELTAEGPLKIHAVFHFLAVVLCVAGILTDLSFLVQLGAFVGLFGAVAFLVFSALVLFKLKRPKIE